MIFKIFVKKKIFLLYNESDKRYYCYIHSNTYKDENHFAHYNLLATTYGWHLSLTGRSMRT